MISKEDYEFGVKYHSIIRSIIIDKACSSIPIEYTDFLMKNHYSTCNCNSGIFNGTSKFYNAWLEAKSYYESEVKDENKVKCKRGRPTNRDK
jgi:hypothetical protein